MINQNASPVIRPNLPFDSLSQGKGQGKLYKNKKWLYQIYIVEKLSGRDIANICNVHSATIFTWLSKHKIEARTFSEALKLARGKRPNWKSPPKRQVKIKCKYCGKIIYRRKSKAKGAKYCSQKCKSNDWIKEHRVIKKCKNCGKEFWAYKSKIGKQYFCNNKCRYKFMRGKNAPKPFSQVKHICEICNKEFYVSNYTDKEGLGRFCSQGCMLKWRSKTFVGKAHHGYKSESHKEYICNFCGKKFTGWTRNGNRYRNHYCSRRCVGFATVAKSILVKDKPKSKLEKIFDSLTPDIINYVGNGKIWKTVKTKTGKTIKNPDFIITGQRKFIEIWGDYWHRNDDPCILINQYAQIGYECLVFWEHEIYNNQEEVLEEVNNFVDI